MKLNSLVRHMVGLLALASAGTLVATSSVACSIIPMTTAEKWQFNQDSRAASKPVQVGHLCEFTNAGLHDGISAGPAKRLGNNRFFQVMGTFDGKVSDILVGDCNTREVIRLVSRVDPSTETAGTSCGPEFSGVLPILKPEGDFTLKEGKSVADLVILARASSNVRVDEALETILLDGLEKRLPRKDRFDLLCGCKLYYPDTPGANL